MANKYHAPYTSPEGTSINYHDILQGKKPDWTAYNNAVSSYLSRPVFEKTPLKPEYFTEAAKTAYEKTGNYVPYDLALSQAQFESGMGRKGRNPSTNPFNVGEFDSGTTQRFSGPKEGTAAYYNLMAKDYLNTATRDDLSQNFVNKNGDRYASNPAYEQKLRDQMQFILKFQEQQNGFQ